METSKDKIEKLRDLTNWEEWQFVVRTLLEGDDLIDVCDGTFVKPVEGSDSYEANLKAWNKADKASRKLIVTTVESKPMRLIMNCKSAKEMWDKLHSVFEMKTDESLCLVQKQFFETRWDNNSNISQHISKIEQLANKMKTLGEEIPSTMLIARILSTLPPQYDHFHSAWDSTETSKKTITNLTARLMTEELRMQSKEDAKQTSTTALFSKLNIKENKISQNYQKRDFRKNRKPACYNCKKTDHKQKDCPGCYICKSKIHIANKCPKKEEKVSDNCNVQKKVALIGNSKVSDCEDLWVIDTGA